MNKRVKLLLRVAALGALAAAAALAQEMPRPPEEGSWHRLVGILQYLEPDYPAAAQSQSPSELEEQRALASEAVSTPSESGRAAEEFRPPLDSTRARIDRAEDPAGVSRDCAELVEDLVQAGGLSRSPRHPPDLTRGEQLYAIGCAACHGANG